jgi:hypothetical protein
MPIRFGALFLILLSGAGTLRADLITLQNGDRVTGAIVKKDGATLTIASAHFGTVNVNWDQVQSVSTDIPAYIEAGGETVQATLTTTDGQVQITSASGTRTVGLAEVVTIRSNAEQDTYERMLDPNLIELWGGAANLGWAGTAGNARTQTFAFAATAARATLNDRTSLYLNAVRASSLVGGVNSATARAVRGGWSYNRNVSPRIFLNVFNDYEYDRFQSLDLRFVLGAGAGYHALESERTRLDLLAGSSYNRERFSTPLTRNSAEFYWGNELNRRLNSIITLNQAYRMFNSLTDTPDFRVNFDLGANMRLSEWLTWNINLSDRYLSNPAVGRLRNDVLYSTGLGITFGRRP